MIYALLSTFKNKDQPYDFSTDFSANSKLVLEGQEMSVPET